MLLLSKIFVTNPLESLAYGRHSKMITVNLIVQVLEELQEFREWPDNKVVKTENRLPKQLCRSADLHLILELGYNWP